MQQTANKQHILLIYAALALTTLLVYEPLRNNDFVSYDDRAYVTQNPNVTRGITARSLLWAFTGHHFYMWHPLTSLSHLLDCQLSGLNPHWHHFTSLLFHIAGTLLLFAVFKRMTGAIWPSAFVAALFALHPLNVEPVAWVAERKTVVSGFFSILTIAAYVRYAERTTIARYLLAILVYALTIMTKPVVVTLPFVLLLLDFWPLQRLQFPHKNKTKDPLPESPESRFQAASPWRLLAEKIPFFALAATLALITFFVQKGGGAVLAAERLPFSYRLGNALVSYLRYISKIVYPARLAVFYPHPGTSLPTWMPIVCLIALAIVSAGIIYRIRRHRYLTVGWLWYLGTLVSVIGLIQAGSQAMADRYAYLPAIGIFAIVAWTVPQLAARWPRHTTALKIAALAILVALSIAARAQVKRWKDDLTLFEHVLAVTDNNAMMENSYGCALFEADRLPEAANHLEKAVRISPKFTLPRTNLGRVYLKQKRYNEAIFCFNDVLRLEKHLPEAYFYLGRSYAALDKTDLAVSNYHQALQFNPDYPEAHYRLALIMTEKGKYDVAVDHFNKALRARPNWFEVHNDAAQLYSQLGNHSQAIAHWTEMVRLRPDIPEVHNNLAWVLATSNDDNIRNPSRAVRLAEKACELTDYKHPGMLDTLAAAYAAAGRFPQAIETAEKALRLAKANNQINVADEIQNHLQLYRAGRPYREK